MAGLTTRTYMAGALILVFGVAIQLFGKARASGYDEKFMEKSAPVSVAGYTFTETKESPGKSYVADERTYELLKPFGIVPRRYMKENHGYEVLLISSNTKESFHDQRVCFPAQKMTPLDEKVHTLDIAGRGKIPVVVASYRTEYGDKVISAYFYRGPGGYYAYPQELAFAMLKNAVLGAKESNNSNYYRFMPQHRDPDEKETLEFIKSYLAEADKTGKGFY